MEYPILSVEELRRRAREQALLWDKVRRIVTKMPPKEVDAILHPLVDTLDQAIDCTQCGHCCRENEPPVLLEEISRLAKHTSLSPAEFRTRFLHPLHPGEADCFQSRPCPFLAGNQCAIYPDRPQSCADYPHLHHPGQKYRFRRILEEARVCPIVFHTLEGLSRIFGNHSDPKYA